MIVKSCAGARPNLWIIQQLSTTEVSFPSTPAQLSRCFVTSVSKSHPPELLFFYVKQKWPRTGPFITPDDYILNNTDPIPSRALFWGFHLRPRQSLDLIIGGPYTQGIYDIVHVAGAK